MMHLTLRQIAQATGAELRGDPELPITGLSSLEDAQTGELSYVASPKFKKKLETCRASAVIVYPGLDSAKHSLLIARDPQLAFVRVMRIFYRAFPDVEPGIGVGAIVDPDAIIPKSAHIGPNAVISKGVRLGEGTVVCAGCFIGADSSLGANCRIFPNVTIRENVKIGDNVVIYPNAVIGSDGFGYVWDGSGHIKVPQVGTVVIENDVEIGAGTTIDRATLGETFIGRGTIIDNLVQIGHNCRIGEFSVICAQAGLAGTTTLGRHVTLAGQVGIAGHLKIGDGAIIEAQSGVASDVAPGSVHFGYPSREIKLAHKIEALLNHLPEYVARLRKLEALLKKSDNRGAGN